MARASFLERLARYEDAMQQLDVLLEGERADDTIRARAQLRVGWVCYWTGKLEQGRAILQETLRRANAQRQTGLEADVLYVAGLIEQSAANLPRAREFYERALSLYRANDNRYGESSALVNLADIGVDNMRFDDARRYGRAALALSTQIGKPFDQAAANVILGSLMYELGDFTRATPYYTESLRLFREMGNGTGESIALRDSAMLALRRGDVSKSLQYAQEAARVAHAVGSPYRDGMAYTVIGDVYLAANDFTRAETAYQHAIALLDRAERGHRALDARAGLLRTAQARGDMEIARQHVEQLLGLLETQNFYDSQEPAAVVLACYHVVVTQDRARAHEILRRGIAELNGRAAQIHDDALRREFLDNNPGARALRQISGEWMTLLANSATE